jgi:hypothetical protein
MQVGRTNRDVLGLTSADEPTIFGIMTPVGEIVHYMHVTIAAQEQVWYSTLFRFVSAAFQRDHTNWPRIAATLMCCGPNLLLTLHSIAPSEVPQAFIVLVVTHNLDLIEDVLMESRGSLPTDLQTSCDAAIAAIREIRQGHPTWHPGAA